jgi:peroxiredoxin
MALTESTMLELGTVAPDFALPDAVTGKTVRRSDFAGRPLLALFMCNHCPFVIHIADALAAFAREYQGKGLAIVGISSNNVQTHPDDGPDKMKAEAARRGYTFPYLYDESQEVAMAYQAACTPDFFLFDRNHKLVYRGQFDDTRPRKEPPQKPTGRDLRLAADAVLAGRPAPERQYPSAGCNIKWKPGNEPKY